MQNSQDPGNTEFVLPIICPHCKKEISLAMLFALLAPVKTDDGEEEDEETPVI